MAQLILYAESPNSPVRVHEINHHKDVLIDANKLLQDHSYSTNYTIWTGRWPEFEQRLIAGLTKNITHILDVNVDITEGAPYEDEEEAGWPVPTRWVQQQQQIISIIKTLIELNSVAPITVTIKHPKIPEYATIRKGSFKLRDLPIHTVVQKSQEADDLCGLMRDTSDLITIDGDSITINNRWHPWLPAAFIFANLGYYRATYAMRLAFARLQLAGGVKAYEDQSVTPIDNEDDFATLMLMHHQKRRKRARGRKIWWLDNDECDRADWRRARFFFGEEEEIIRNFNKITDAQPFPHEIMGEWF